MNSLEKLIQKTKIFDKEKEKYINDCIEKEPFSILYLKNQTPEICMKAVKLDGLTLKFVKPELQQKKFV